MSEEHSKSVGAEPTTLGMSNPSPQATSPFPRIGAGSAALGMPDTATSSDSDKEVFGDLLWPRSKRIFCMDTVLTTRTGP